MKIFSFSLLALIAATAVARETSHAPGLALTQDPLVMRLDKDEFRIAFGINGERCGDAGCSGMIRYRVKWRTADGISRSEVKQVSFKLLPNTQRTITVDRQYFDTAEGQHTTDVVKVSVDAIDYRVGTFEHGKQFARN
jgi:hypothetical protein